MNVSTPSSTIRRTDATHSTGDLHLLGEQRPDLAGVLDRFGGDVADHRRTRHRAIRPSSMACARSSQTSAIRAEWNGPDTGSEITRRAPASRSGDLGGGEGGAGVPEMTTCPGALSFATTRSAGECDRGDHLGHDCAVEPDDGRHATLDRGSVPSARRAGPPGAAHRGTRARRRRPARRTRRPSARRRRPGQDRCAPRSAAQARRPRSSAGRAASSACRSAARRAPPRRARERDHPSTASAISKIAAARLEIPSARSRPIPTDWEPWGEKSSATVTRRLPSRSGAGRTRPPRRSR